MSSQATGQQVMIDNKPGASGNIGAAQVARAPADGYTFLHSVSSTLIQNRVMFKTLGFDPDKDLTIVSGTSSGVLPVVVHKSLPAEVKDLKSFIEYAKKQQDELRLVGAWLLGPHLRADVEREVRPHDGGRDLQGRGADVAGHGSGLSCRPRWAARRR